MTPRPTPSTHDSRCALTTPVGVSRAPIARLGVAARTAMVSVALAAAPALGVQDDQAAAPLTPPPITDDPKAPVVLTLLLLGVLVVATLFAATMPSKRGHQD